MNRLHPVSMLYFAVSSLKESLSYTWVIPLLFVLFKSKSSQSPWFIAAAVLLLLLVILSVGWLRWKSFVYQVNPGSIYIKSGIWVKKERWITPERVQSVDSTVRVYDRLFHTMTLTLEAAGGEKSGMVLSCISQEEEERIRRVLLQKPSPGADAAGQVASEQPRITAVDLSEQIGIPLRDLMLHSTLSPKFGITFVLLFSGLMKIWDGSRRDAEALFAKLPLWLGPYWILYSLLLLAAVSWIISLSITLVGDYRFTLRREEDELCIERGLLEKKKTTIRQKRIQSILIVQRPLQRLLGLVSIQAVVIRGGEKEESRKTSVLMPILKAKEVPGFLRRYTEYRLADSYRRLDKKSWRHYVVFPFFAGLLVCVPIVLWVPRPYGGLGLLIPILVFILGWMEFKHVGWWIEEDQMSIRYGTLSRRMVIMHRNRIQWSRTTQTVLQRRRGLASFKAAMASGKDAMKVSLRHVPANEASKAMAWTQKQETCVSK